MEKENNHFYFKGIKISDIGWGGLQTLIKDLLSDQRPVYFCLTDVGNLMMAQKDTQLAAAINAAALSIADGAPLAWFGRLTGRRRVERISGVKLFQHLIHHTNYKHFLLGDTTARQRRVIQKARTVNPDLQIDGYSPPFRTYFSHSEEQLMVRKIAQAQPDLIWISFGGGKQDKWMYRNAAALDHGIMIGVGAAFKYYTGELAIPSRWMQRLGLQWMTRLAKHPVRWMTKGPFAWRLIFFLQFPFEFIKARVRKRFTAGSTS